MISQDNFGHPGGRLPWCELRCEVLAAALVAASRGRIIGIPLPSSSEPFGSFKLSSADGCSSLLHGLFTRQRPLPNQGSHPQDGRFTRATAPGGPHWTRENNWALGVRLAYEYTDDPAYAA